MKIMTPDRRASIEFQLDWSSPFATHRERLYASGIDFLCDNFPHTMRQKVANLKPGESCQVNAEAGELLPGYDNKKVITFPSRLFKTPNPGQIKDLHIGRFYPRAFAWQGFNCDKRDYQPFRLVNKTEDEMTADCNHPLATYPFTLSAKMIRPLPPLENHGSGINDILEMTTAKGPGMQISHAKVATDFYASYPFKRLDDSNDAVFYSTPRMVDHLDTTAIEQVRNIYARLLKPGIKVLDLMSSWTSHIPDTHTEMDVTGLGMNQAELDANKLLQSRVVHDLNENTALPFADDQFEAVICTVSIEYLVKPLEVMHQIARVLKHGGIFITTFSDRWFPPKAIIQWPEMHPFERVGLVLDYFLKTEQFSYLNTESIRGLPRPASDRYSRQLTCSDPVFAVWGYVCEPASRENSIADTIVIDDHLTSKNDKVV